VAVLCLCANQEYRFSVIAAIKLSSAFERGVMETFHKVSTKYLPLYMAEFQFRYNQREMPDMFGVAIARC
jgi:ISXO2 transposase-like protein